MNQNLIFDTNPEDYTPTRKERKMSRKAQQRARANNVVQFDRGRQQQRGLELESIKPKTANQRKTFKLYGENKNLLLHGVPGSGKTFISLYLALDEILNQNSETLNKVVIIRSAQSSKGIGFLPGTAKQKMEVYETPYSTICSKLFDRGDAYQCLKNKGIIEFESTSFLRGTTIDDSIIIVDEVQNLLHSEWLTVLTRVGENSRLILCGDRRQDDLTSKRYNEESGIESLMKVCSKISSMSTIQFEVDDIVRSGFAKEVIMAMIECGM